MILSGIWFSDRIHPRMKVSELDTLGNDRFLCRFYFEVIPIYYLTLEI